MEHEIMRAALIALIKAHIIIGRVSWSKLSDQDTGRLSDGCGLIRSAVLGLSGLPDSTLGGVMLKYNITDADLGE